MFRVGRMPGGKFMHKVFNTTTERDRIQWILPAASKGGPSWLPISVIYTYEKLKERDMNLWWGSQYSDEDADTHNFILGYSSDNFALWAAYQFNREEGSNFITPQAAAPFWLVMQKADVNMVDIYNKTKLGPVTFEAEMVYAWGYMTDLKILQSPFPVPTYSPDDVEIESFNWMMQATFDGGPFDIYTGWLHVDGDADGAIADLMNPTGDNTRHNMAGAGNDWDLLFFLTSDEGTHASTFGGIGNWSKAGSNPYGIDLLYIGGGFDVSPTVNISGVWGWANADAVPTGDKYIGQEFNLWLTWQIMEGLQYKALFAFFDAGDFWEDASEYAFNYLGPVYFTRHTNTSKEGSTWALTHQLTLSF